MGGWEAAYDEEGKLEEGGWGVWEQPEGERWVSQGGDSSSLSFCHYWKPLCHDCSSAGDSLTIDMLHHGRDRWGRRLGWGWGVAREGGRGAGGEGS